MSNDRPEDEELRQALEQLERKKERVRAAQERWRRWQGESHRRSGWEDWTGLEAEWKSLERDLHTFWAGLEGRWRGFGRGWREGAKAPTSLPTSEESGMSRRRRQQEAQGAQQDEDLGRLAAEKLKEFLEPEDSEAKVRRRQERDRQREERRRQRRAESQGDMVALGVGLATGGLVSLLAIPTVAAVGAGFLGAGVVGYGLRFLNRQERRPRQMRIAAPPVMAEGLADSRAETVRAILEQAADLLQEAQKRAAKLEDAEAKQLIERLAHTGQRIIDAVAARPGLLPRAQRVLTYHAERAVYLAETLAALGASKAADPSRFVAAKHVLARMDNLFERTALELAAGDAKELDLELRLIDQALDEDLRP